MLTANLPRLLTDIKNKLAKQKDEVLSGNFFRVVDKEDFEFSTRELAEPENEAYRSYRVVGYMFPGLPTDITNKCPPWQKHLTMPRKREDLPDNRTSFIVYKNGNFIPDRNGVFTTRATDGANTDSDCGCKLCRRRARWNSKIAASTLRSGKNLKR